MDLHPALPLAPVRHSPTPRADEAAPDQPWWLALLGAPAPNTAEVRALGALGVWTSLRAGEWVFQRPQRAQALVALASGAVALGWRAPRGAFHHARIVRGPAWLDQSAAWLDEPHAMDAQALGPARVLALPVAALGPALTAHPGLWPRLLRGLAREVQALAATTHELMHKDAPARLAHWLSQHCQPLAEQPGQALVRLGERKRDLASQLAITPETLSRLMRSFSHQGVIEVSGYLVRVLDLGALRRLAEA